MFGSKKYGLRGMMLILIIYLLVVMTTIKILQNKYLNTKEKHQRKPKNFEDVNATKNNVRRLFITSAVNVTRIASDAASTVVNTTADAFNAASVAINADQMHESKTLRHCELHLKVGNDASKTYERVPDLTNDEKVTETLRKGCNNFMKEYDFMTSHEYTSFFSEKELKFPIAYTILIHHQLHQFSMLLSAIYRRQNLHCVHVDVKSNSTFRNGVEMIASCFPNVFISSKSERVVYASFSRLQADVHCMRDLLAVPKYLYNWTHLINLCGQDFPISTNYEIVQQLKQLKNKNVMAGTRDLNQISIDRTKYIYRITNITDKNGETHEEVRSTNILLDPPPLNITQVKSMAYATFTRDFLQWALVDSKEGSALLNWSSFTRTPDEHYWGMLNILPTATGGSHTMLWWGVARAVWWNGKNRTCGGYWKHNICVFGADDLQWIVKQPQMFANKFDITHDVTPVTCIRELLNQRTKGNNATWNQHKVPRNLPRQMLK